MRLACTGRRVWGVFSLRWHQKQRPNRMALGLYPAFGLTGMSVGDGLTGSHHIKNR